MYCKLFLYLLICGELANLIDAIPLYGPQVEGAKVNEFPFIASLQSKVPHNQQGEKHFCTGSLITVKDVLTAGHCITRTAAEKIQVLLGVVNVNSNYSKYNVSWMVTYDQWAHNFGLPKKFQINDIGIVRLSTSVKGRNIKPVVITGLTTPQLYRSEAVMVGWGFLPHKGRLARHLRKAYVNIHEPGYCLRQIYLMTNKHLNLESNKLCSAAKPYAITTPGDSGGPLLNKHNELVGVISGTGSNDHWGNFTQQFINQYEISIHFSIDFYRNFISSVVNVI